LVFKNHLQESARSKQQLASIPEQADAYRVAKNRAESTNILIITARSVE